MDYARLCPKCGRQIFYSSEKNLKVANRKNVVCHKCSNRRLAWAERARQNRRSVSYELLGGKPRYKILFEEQNGLCLKCGLGTQWNGMPLKLQLDHVDGDRSNNKRNNNRLLCPNCHSQTPTFSGRNNRCSDEPGLLKVGVQLKKEVVVSKPFPQSFGGFCSTPKIVESGH
jgi:Zn finger protein HypA/HybF involved in hydrogenase expression